MLLFCIIDSIRLYHFNELIPGDIDRKFRRGESHNERHQIPVINTESICLAFGRAREQ